MKKRHPKRATPPVVASDFSLDRLRRAQWCPMFESAMRLRLIMGGMRYGLLDNQRPRQYRLLDSIAKRLELYRRDHNLEHVVDIANLCLIEFANPSFRNAALRPIDDGEHVEPTNRNKGGEEVA